MTNRQFYVSNKALAEAFKKFCKGTKGVNCDSCPVEKEISEKGIKTSDCKLVWLDMPHCEEPRVSGIVSVHCTQCKKWETPLHGSVNNEFCRDGVCRTDPDKIDEACVWFDPRNPSPIIEPDAPAPAPSAPATESDPNGLKPSDPGAKLDSGKNMLGLVLDGFAPAVVEVGKVGTYGATKYSPNGWKSVEGAKRRYMDALMRHLFAHLNGEKTDKESGLSHLAHAAWNVLALLTFEVKGGGE